MTNRTRQATLDAPPPGIVDARVGRSRSGTLPLPLLLLQRLTLSVTPSGPDRAAAATSMRSHRRRASTGGNLPRRAYAALPAEASRFIRRVSFDRFYRKLGANLTFLCHAIRGFVGMPWVAHADLDSMEAVDPHIIDAKLEVRVPDGLVRIPLKGAAQPDHMYLLVEYQSTASPWMGRRLADEVVKLYSAFPRGWAGYLPGSLPPVVPLVFYNGGADWTAGRDFADLIGGHEDFRSVTRRVPLDGPGLEGNLVVALFGLWQARSLPEAQAAATRLRNRVKSDLLESHWHSASKGVHPP